MTFTNDELIALLNDIFEWKRTGELPADARFRSFSKEHNVSRAWLQEEVLMEGHKRFRFIVPLLFADKPRMYLGK